MIQEPTDVLFEKFKRLDLSDVFLFACEHNLVKTSPQKHNCVNMDTALCTCVVACDAAFAVAGDSGSCFSVLVL